MRKTRSNLWTVVLVIAACCAPTTAGQEYQLRGSEFDIPIYATETHQKMLAEVIGCAVWVRSFYNTFDIRDTIPNVGMIVWRAVPTEFPDGGFLCTRRVGICWGETFDGDSLRPVIRLSARLMHRVPLIKHELLHIVVQSKGEDHVPDHGLPWGFCEWR